MLICYGFGVDYLLLPCPLLTLCHNLDFLEKECLVLAWTPGLLLFTFFLQVVADVLPLVFLAMLGK